MPIIGWIRDLFGIQKDMYETKKTRLEIEKIEDEKREKLITLATVEDVKRYDPKVKELQRCILEDMGERIEAPPLDNIPSIRRVIILLLITAAISFILGFISAILFN